MGDRLMLRLGEARAVAALERPHVRPMDFTGRPLKGMVFLEPDGVSASRDLKRWIEQARAFLTALPPKS